MQVVDLTSNRAVVAFELFNEDKEPVSYKSVSFMVYNGILNIMTKTEYLFENTTRKMSIEYIEYSKTILEEVKVYSKKIKEYVDNGKYAFYFLFDYGNGVIEIANEKNGIFEYNGK